MTGIWFMVTFCLILRQRVSPSISGIMMSLMIRSGAFLWMRLSASLPLVHSCMWKFTASSRQMYFRISSSSSTTSTRHLVRERTFSSASPDTDWTGTTSAVCAGMMNFCASSSISSGFRCAQPRGRRMMKREPFLPSLFSAVMIPWCSSTSERLRCSPMPVPTLELLWLLRI